MSALVRRGATVLITAFTNTAVDHVLRKIQAAGTVDMTTTARLLPRSAAAAAAGAPPDIAHLVLRPEDFKSTSDLQARLGRVTVMATTCQNMQHPLLRRRVFDTCIVDEASQVLLPSKCVCLCLCLCLCVFAYVKKDSERESERERKGSE